MHHVFFPALAWIAFLARVWSRLRITRSWGLDDWFMVLAALCSVLFTPFFYVYIKLGYFGWHQEDVPKDYDPSPGLFYFYIAQLFYNPILALVKCSILVFILHIGRTRKGLPWMVYSVLTLTVLHAVGFFFAVLLSCVPIKAIWTPGLKPSAECIDNSFHIIISGVTVMTDILVLALPF
ncbi:uncharacterized protein CC84DRAFT_1226915 [Paraphaeosphaeria sporulosa]|uniref:Rhodopsin domain-containing protein n=1 Tax=Paraphaeosphaeria sporulosa TaxID=1460663 RepID=A0A177CZH7_9PLEO|nr:uncharacterized protein CC84DRAFT_1226915 [Paraphaeosphaeria sporulosa]OAG12531.1 hypothetical protein CC84DRAFT_1226915 [Paraphaeosphaeria sporulosa]